MKVKLRLCTYLFCMTWLVFLVSEVYAVPLENPVKRETRAEKAAKRVSEIIKELNLSNEQQKQLEANRSRNREKNTELFNSIKTKRDELRKELQKPELNMTKINQVNNELKELQGKMEDNRLNAVLEIRKILGAKQFAKYMEMVGMR